MFLKTNKNEELQEIMEKGREKLQKEMNITSLIKRLRYLEIILENSLLHKKSRRMNVAHTYHNIIDLDQDNNENVEMPSLSWQDIKDLKASPRDDDGPIENAGKRHDIEHLDSQSNRPMYTDEEFEGGIATGAPAPVAADKTRLKKTKKPKFNVYTNNVKPIPGWNNDDYISSESEGGNQAPKLWYFSKDENIEYIKFFDTEIDYNLKK